jgi:hypothetical protein
MAIPATPTRGENTEVEEDEVKTARDGVYIVAGSGRRP